RELRVRQHAAGLLPRARGRAVRGPRAGDGAGRQPKRSRGAGPARAHRRADPQPRPVSDAYYGDPRLDRVLESYRQRLGDTAFLFPIGALRAARTLLEISG